MAKGGLIWHWMLAGYLWLVTWVSLGAWNAQDQPHLLSALRSGGRLEMGDLGYLGFTALPAVLFSLGMVWRSRLFVFSTIVFDLIWMTMQVQSWWLPYLFGAKKAWQLRYASGPTTKVLPSYGKHIAPDGMHLVISILLVLCIVAAGKTLGMFGTTYSSRRIERTIDRALVAGNEWGDCAGAARRGACPGAGRGGCPAVDIFAETCGA